MLTLGTPSIPVHHLLHQIRTDRTRVFHHVLGNSQRRGQHILAPLARLGKQAIKHLVTRRIRAARSDSLHSARMPDQAGQEVRTTSLHNEAAAGKDEADFGAGMHYAHVHRQRHCDADANGGALDGADGGFETMMDGEGYAAASVFFLLVNEILFTSHVNLAFPLIIRLFVFFFGGGATRELEIWQYWGILTHLYALAPSPHPRPRAHPCQIHRLDLRLRRRCGRGLLRQYILLVHRRRIACRLGLSRRASWA